MNYQELLAELSKPLPYQWRVQSRNKDKTKAICTAFIDARDVMNRLDTTGVLWETQYKEVAGFIFCGITIYIGEEILTRWDCGSRIEDDSKDQMYDQAGKSAASDALKRAAVNWGIGRFLYDLPHVTLPCDQHGGVVDETGARVWDLTKHINGLNERKSTPVKKSTPAKKAEEVTTPAVQAPEPTTIIESVPEGKVDGEQVPLPQEKLDLMLKFLQEGKISEVETAIKKYKLTASQRTVLAASIKNAKTAKK